MEISRVDLLSKRKKADLLILPFWQDHKKAVPAADFKGVDSTLKHLLGTGDFTAKLSETALLYSDTLIEGRALLVGLGKKEEITVEKLRRAYASALKSALQMKLGTLNVVAPFKGPINEKELVLGIVEGLLLPNYVFDAHKKPAVEGSQLIARAALIGVGKEAENVIERAEIIAQGVYLARDLVNGNADDVTPQYLAKVAQGFGKTLTNVETTIFDKKRIEKEKMGLLLAVNRGSVHEPVLIICKYTGNPKSKDHTILVGKGVTFDTGGLNLKPTGGMETMRGDMAGAAVCLASILIASELKLKINLTVVIPSTENGIDSLSYKPGDTYKSYSGKTVEIGNTDAEGRLILADALSYAIKNLKPTRILDIATLTGAMDVAMGPEAFGFFTNDDKIAEGLSKASENTAERTLRFPLIEEYRDNLKSDMADIRNIGGRPGGAIIAAIFLKEFVENTPWAHLDIAPVEYYPEARRYHPKCGTGFGVRLLADYLSNL